METKQRISGDELEFDLADRLRKALRVSHMSAGELADALEVHRNAVSGWINDKHMPRPRDIRRTAEITGVPVEWLVTGKAPIREDEGPLCAPRDLNPEPADYGSALGDGFDSINLPSIPNTADALLALIPEGVR